jgi:hypothetical protein
MQKIWKDNLIAAIFSAWLVPAMNDWQRVSAYFCCAKAKIANIERWLDLTSSKMAN